jgi:uncharacterized membrane protein
VTQSSDLTLANDIPNLAIARYNRLANYSHWATLFFYCVLLVLFSVNQWLRPQGISLFQWSVQCLPLLMFWFGLRVKRRRTYLWLCFVLLLYFIKGVEGVMSLNAGLFDWVLLSGSVGLFVSCLATARWLLLKEQNEFALTSD